VKSRSVVIAKCLDIYTRISFLMGNADLRAAFSRFVRLPEVVDFGNWLIILRLQIPRNKLVVVLESVNLFRIQREIVGGPVLLLL
jgi:hypothetical protein